MAKKNGPWAPSLHHILLNSYGQFLVTISFNLLATNDEEDRSLKSLLSVASRTPHSPDFLPVSLASPSQYPSLILLFCPVRAQSWNLSSASTHSINDRSAV